MRKYYLKSVPSLKTPDHPVCIDTLPRAAFSYYLIVDAGISGYG